MVAGHRHVRAEFPHRSSSRDFFAPSSAHFSNRLLQIAAYPKAYPQYFVDLSWSPAA
ncbi:hypothetical protein V6U90_27210 [Micromonospora sp. CPCC 206060]|uniref:hypothetical protein n=1 Tax=Micromonospora sp. CPCC 206060 TaxID=3122406 RepID=UPI002FEEC4D1